MSQRKRARVFSSEFKKQAVERMLAGESGSALARELQLRRKLLYEWKDRYWVGGVKALRGRGRGRQGERLGLGPQVSPGRGELLQARRRIAELERIVGRQPAAAGLRQRAYVPATTDSKHPWPVWPNLVRGIQTTGLNQLSRRRYHLSPPEGRVRLLGGGVGCPLAARGGLGAGAGSG